MNVEAVLSNIHSFTSSLKTSFAKSLSAEDMKLVAFEGFAFFIPLGILPDHASVDSSNRMVPYIFDKQRPELINWLRTPMDKSKVFTNGPKVAKVGKAAAKGTAKSKVAAKRASAPSDNEMNIHADTTGGDQKRRKSNSGVAEQNVSSEQLVKVVAEPTQAGDDIARA